jgi:uncharacterized Zn finger protein
MFIVEPKVLSQLGQVKKNLMIFKYQELTRKFLELFWIFTYFNWKYFSPQYTNYEEHFRLS